MSNYRYQGTRPRRTRGPVKPCGTDAAYKRHLKNREVPCTPCTAAHTTAVREWDQKRKATR
jgi:hypothetical protein